MRNCNMLQMKICAAVYVKENAFNIDSSFGNVKNKYKIMMSNTNLILMIFYEI